ncbi:MAG: ASKHA domain-containing protein [Muribaculaceae bacterium]|nr:ASKHA domain-containing protein [Muribaculaceae bacterium]
MSETVKLTITGIKINGAARKVEVTHPLGATLLSTLQDKQLISASFCGGRGVCGRCRVRFLQAAPLPTSMERRAFTAEELRMGYRLACMTRPKDSCVIQLEFIESDKMDIVTDMIALSESADLNSQSQIIIAVDLGTTTIAMQLMDMQSGQILDTYCAMNPQRSYGADVLSRIQAAEAGHGEILKDCVWKVLQDGIARFYKTMEQVEAAERCFVAEAEQAETDAVSSAAGQSVGRIACMCIAGNTTMEHLLMGLSTSGLGKSPFTPVTVGLQKCTLPMKETATQTAQATVSSDVLPLSGYALPADTQSLPVYVLPSISAFVGGDIVAGLYCCHLLEALQNSAGILTDIDVGISDDSSAEFLDDNSAVLFLDLGTNGEMAITDGKRMIVTATAAGPAFEGGAGAAVQGSDMIALTASLLKQGVIDETGLLAERYFEQGVTIDSRTRRIKEADIEEAGVKEEAGSHTESVSDATLIHLSQQDIRALQMAKAAVRAGVDILYQKMGHPTITKVYLAGGFGYYLDVKAAIAIGLLPEQWKDVIAAVGNTSLAGAFALGRDFYTGRLLEGTLEKQLQRIESVNLAKEEDFAGLYMQYLNFPAMET